MAIYIIVDKDTKTLQPGEVRAGEIEVHGGDIFVIAPGVDSNVKFVAADGESPTFAVQIQQSNANSFDIEFESDLSPVLSISDGVKLPNVMVDAEDADTMVVVAGNDVELDHYHGSSNGSDTFTAGDNFKTNHHIKTGDGNDSISIGNNAELDDIEMGEGNNSLVVGNEATIKDIKTGDGDNTIAVGSDAEIHKIETGKGDDAVTVGNNAVIHEIKTEDGDDAIVIGNDAEVHKIDADDGDDYIFIGNDFDIDNFHAGDGNDTVVLGVGGSVDDLDGGNDFDVLISVDEYPDAENFEDIRCFVSGTLICTNLGQKPVETLQPGDLIATLDSGMQPVRWVGSATVPGSGDFAPIRFEQGAIGNQRPLLVSPQHRILLTGWQSELFFGSPEVLVPAKHLVNGSTVRRIEMPEVTYYHLLFDNHQIVWSDGALTESFHPRDVLSLSSEQRQEIIALFPELSGGAAACGDTARTCLKRFEACLLAA